MLLFLASLIEGPPVAIDATGMPPQLSIIRRVVAEKGWDISCEGRSGEEGVLRIMLPHGTTSEGASKFQQSIMEIASSSRSLSAAEAQNPSCDSKPMLEAAEGNAPQFVLAYASSEHLTALVTVARECGFSKAFIRPWQEGDLIGGEPGQGWQTLDAGEDAIKRDGPLICFLNVGLTPIIKAAKIPSPHP